MTPQRRPSLPPLTTRQRLVTHDPALAEPTRRAVNWRGVTLGLVGVVLLCAITPYNNYVMNNNDLVGNALPTGMLLFTFVVVLLVNAPLHRFAPRRAFSSGELAVAMGMVFVA